MGGDRRRLRGAEQRPLKGYAPLVVLVAAVLAMVVIVPSKVPDDQAAAGGPAGEVPVGQTASGWGETVQACADRELQVPDSGYSPPCFEHTGEANGGTTTPGVDADSIKVAYRITAQDLLVLLGQLGGVQLDESTAEMARTAEALVEYFNANFEFYGRKIELVSYEGRGDILAEFTGAGQDQANNDAIRVASDLGAFAELNAISQPYADALSRNDVVGIGAPYMSREWFEAHRPYIWSMFPDCTVTAEAAARYANARLFGRNADFAGGDVEGEARSLAVIAPNNLEYQQCVDSFEEMIGSEGNEVGLRLDYTINPEQLQVQAATIMAKLVDEGTTSVSCACDPIMQMYLAKEASAAGYYPEWLIAGVGFIDIDLGGQIVYQNAPDQWTRAFGGSPSAAPQPPETSVAHAAYRTVRDDEPSLFVDQIYSQILILALGIQMAGPDLTPTTFETGLFAYPGGAGHAGSWDFSLGHYTPVTDIREIWWDPAAISAFNGEAGTYADNGERYAQEDVPEGDPEVFP